MPSPPPDATLVERVGVLEEEIKTIKKAFPLDDLGDPAIERHRLQHKAIDRAEKEVEAYKIEITKKALTAILALVGSVALWAFRSKLGI